ncbi:carboxypeptidase-like regulatory domain-containing protein [Ferruginibacter sp. SUN106]|uniref:carboxypeptidase-like regulatory domain-containing protein n=1 Tax=Ferruginibacter sp. SUN106 TaxID=2978348 RepID=UPI003D35E6EC
MQQIQLSIPEPCHEDWQNMNPTEQGRFCNACAKQVIDFSTMSDREVLNYFATIKNENVCGRAYPDQLERAITMPKDPKKRLFWHWNYITMLFLFFSKTNTAKAQIGKVAFNSSKLDSIKKTDVSNALSGRVRGIETRNDYGVISGKVKDVNSNPIPFASIRIKGESSGVAADANGVFTIKGDKKKNILQLAAVGYIQKEIVLDGLTDFNFILIKSTVKDPQIVITAGMMIKRPVNKILIENINIQIKDNATYQPIDKATVILKRTNSEKMDSVFTTGKGTYKLKNIYKDESYLIKITADGYQEQTMEIRIDNLDGSNITKQVFLEKAAVATDFKKMDSVIILSNMPHKIKCTMGATSVVMGAAISEVTVERTFSDSIKSVATKITGALKISPNPVQKGNAIKLTLKLKETGVFNIRITDAAGRIVVQKQSIATTKQYIEELPTNSSWGSGIYYVSIYSSNQKMISTSNFIIQ